MSTSEISPAFGQNILTPTAFLDRAKTSFGERTAVLADQSFLTYDAFAERCEKLAGALIDLGLEIGETVSVLAPNTQTILELHFGVPLAGNVLNALNVRLSPSELTYILDHAEARVVVVDHEYRHLLLDACTRLPGLRVVVAGGPADEYESLVRSASPTRRTTVSENSLLSLPYTSGTTGNPKGVMYSHRGAYLQALSMVASCGLGPDSVFLWTLPMFHCNGWCFPWAVTAVGATHVPLRKADPDLIWHAIRTQGVTHFNAAPTVLTSLVHHREARQGPPPQHVRVATGGAPPSPDLLSRLDDLGIEVTHLYGLTETYGPAVVGEWLDEWDKLPRSDRAKLKARQGVANLVATSLRVIDADGRDVPRDGSTLGEVVLRGNNVMMGYFKDPAATADATFEGGFRTGDLGVLHPDGQLELRDRSKDIIISGGENISSIEVEQALATHPDVLECAVIAAPHARWGETPVAFVSRQPGSQVGESELIDHVRAQIAKFKAPTAVIFGELPKTGTGKIQKFALRASIAQ
jgi:fatty-acyl-CoA synthase